MINVLLCIMAGVILLPVLIGLLKMLFKNNDNDYDSTHQSID